MMHFTKKKMVWFVVFMITFLSLSVEAISPYKFYKKLIKREKIGIIREYYSEDLTYDILANRGDDIIVEKIIGTVVNKRKDGRILGGDPNYNYISYSGVKGAKKGDVILTICIYTPGNRAEDDVCERFDYIIEEKEK